MVNSGIWEMFTERKFGNFEGVLQSWEKYIVHPSTRSKNIWIEIMIENSKSLYTHQ